MKKISIDLIKQLRAKSSAGMMDCKKALVAADCNIEKAIVWLREKGIVKAQERADRESKEGVCISIINPEAAGIIEMNCETDFVAKNADFISATKEKLVQFMTGPLDESVSDLAFKYGENIVVRRYKIFDNFDFNVAEYTHTNHKSSAIVFGYGSGEALRNVAMHIVAMKPTYLTKADIPMDILAQEKEVLMNEALNENKTVKKPKPENIIERIVSGRINKYVNNVCLENQEYVKDSSMTIAQYLKSAGSSIEGFELYNLGE